MYSRQALYPWSPLYPSPTSSLQSQKASSSLCSPAESWSSDLYTYASGITIVTTRSNLFLSSTPGIMPVIVWHETQNQRRKSVCPVYMGVLSAIYVYVCTMCMNWARRPERDLGPLRLELQTAVSPQCGRMLRTEPRSSGIEASNLHHWAISPTPSA